MRHFAFYGEHILLFSQDHAYICFFRFLCAADATDDIFVGNVVGNGDFVWTDCVSVLDYREVLRNLEMFGGFGMSFVGIARTDSWTD
jgi:hypothetical protein